MRREVLQQLVQTLPPVVYAAAYGSAVVKQAGYKGSGMIDYIIAVDDAADWHRKNLVKNGGTHYSMLRVFGAQALARIQAAGAGVYFNVPNLQGQCKDVAKAKYAVVEHRVLCNELEDWQNLYLSGRLQKPVVTLVDCLRVEAAKQRNLEMACATALLLLPESFSEHMLYSTISAISYTGDPRMRLGEHPDKALQIAASQIELFRDLYAPALQALRSHVSCSHDAATPSLLSQDMSPGSRARLLLSLPTAVVAMATRFGHAGGGPSDLTRDKEREELLADTIRRRPSFVTETLPVCLAGLVGPAARVQMVKGFFSFGMGTALEYIQHKLGRARAPRFDGTAFKK